LRDTLTACKGKFLVSYNDCEFIRELYKDFQIESVSHLNNLCALSDGPEDEEESDDKNSLNLPAELLEDAWISTDSNLEIICGDGALSFWHQIF